MPNGLPINFLTLVALLMASTHQEIEGGLETVSAFAKNTQEAVRSLRQGIETLNQSVTQLRNLRENLKG